MFRVSEHLRIKTKVSPGLRKQSLRKVGTNCQDVFLQTQENSKNLNNLGTAWRNSLESAAILGPWRSGSTNICRVFLRQPQGPSASYIFVYADISWEKTGAAMHVGILPSLHHTLQAGAALLEMPYVLL